MFKQGFEYIVIGQQFEKVDDYNLPKEYELVNDVFVRVENELEDLKAENKRLHETLKRVIQISNLNNVAAICGAEHEAVEAVYHLRGEYAKLRDK